MQWGRALGAFWQTLIQPACTHSKISALGDSAYCPDCGKRVKLVWSFIQCRECGQKRMPRQTTSADLEPLHRYCRHCGAEGFRLVKRDVIEAYELLYCLSTREIDYRETARPTTGVGDKGHSVGSGGSVFATPPNILEGNVVYRHPLPTLERHSKAF